jgi:YVTN family beta-propeller protein
VLDGATCDAQVTSGCGQIPKAVRVGLSPQAIAIDLSTDTVYVADQGFNDLGQSGDTVSVLDGASCNGVRSSGCGNVHTITVGKGPGGIALDDATQTAYITNQTAGTVSVIDMATCDGTDTSGCGQKTTTITVGASPFAVTVDQKRHILYVANNFDDTISFISTAACDATNTSGCAKPAPTVQVGKGPEALALDSLGNTLYVANAVDNTVSVLDASSCQSGLRDCRTAPRVAEVGTQPSGVAVDTTNNSVYVSNQGLGSVSVLDAKTCNSNETAGCSKPRATVHVGSSPAGVAVDQATNTVYVANNGGNTVSVIDAASCNATDQSGCSRPVATVRVGSNPFGIAVDQTTDSVYVTQPGASNEIDSTDAGNTDQGDTVSVVNGASCNATDQSGCSQSPVTVTVGQGPFALAIDAATNTIYVANTGELFESGHGGDTVSVIDGATCDGVDDSGCGQTPARVTVGPYPFGVAVDGAANKVFVVNNNGGDGPSSLSVINGSTCDATTVSGCIMTPRSIPGVGRAPNGIAFDPSTNSVYTANYQDASVSVIRTTNRNSATSLPRLAAGSLPSAVAVDPVDHTIYVADTESGTVAVLPDRMAASG